MGVRDVTGTITDMQGIVKFDAENPDSSYFDVTVRVNTINTDNKKRDAHLKNEDFFETDKWPTLRFKSKRIVKQDEIFGTYGSLTIKNVTKDVFVPFRIEETEKTITFMGDNIVNRLDYNVGEGTDTFKVGIEINVEVICVLNKKK
jgi:polyisoprenoid-binding protein YceI